jgi:hypothetical protein
MDSDVTEECLDRDRGPSFGAHRSFQRLRFLTCSPYEALLCKERSQRVFENLSSESKQGLKEPTFNIKEALSIAQAILNSSRSGIDQVLVLGYGIYTHWVGSLALFGVLANVPK